MAKRFVPTLTFLFFIITIVPGLYDSFLISTAKADENLIKAGEEVYRRYCIGCHGEKGDGKGKAASLLVVKPRDFTSGIFKFKSTLIGSLPTDEDLMHTVTKGLPGSAMPGNVLMPERERHAVIEYIKGFSERWKNERRQSPIAIPETPIYINSPESIRKGRDLYTEMAVLYVMVRKVTVKDQQPLS